MSNFMEFMEHGKPENEDILEEYARKPNYSNKIHRPMREK